jgi:hypothetical protein
VTEIALFTIIFIVTIYIEVIMSTPALMIRS